MLLALACLLAISCDLRARAIDVTLVPSPDLTTRADLHANVARLEFVIDSPSGLYGPEDAMTRGNLSVEDADNNPSDLELVARVPFDRGFPSVRITEGGLPDVPIDVRVRGFTSDDVLYAEGTVRNLDFQGGVQNVRVAFDVRPEHQPPRVGVLQLIPNPPCGAPTMLVIFSRPIDPGTALAMPAIRFTPGGLPRSISIEATGTVAQVGVPLAVLEPDVAQYEIEIGEGIHTEDDVAFDQVPTTAQPDTFRTAFLPPCR
jgi:hypothetical protein